METIKRRDFVGAAAAVTLAAGYSLASDGDRLRVGVIGHTGRGNFGHGLDTVWLRLPSEAQIVGVADADSAGLAKAKQQLKVDRGYRDYREMLAATKPDIVAVCPRHPDQHPRMILAAVELGAKGIYCEKPFCRTLTEADLVQQACEQHNVKLAVAHRNRYHPTLQAIDRIIEAGDIGRVLELRGRGKGDRRGGAEDLWVLGCHVFNLFQYFAGPAVTCSAVVKKDGRTVTKADVVEGNEALGPLAGNEVHARFEHTSGMTSYFDSIANDQTSNEGFGLQIIASVGVIDIKLDLDPLAYLVSGNPFQASASGKPWVPITSAGAGQHESIEGIADAVSHHETAARDLIDAIRNDRQPLCNLDEAVMTIEMIHGVFASHRFSGQAIKLPLLERTHPLLLLD